MSHEAQEKLSHLQTEVESLKSKLEKQTTAYSELLTQFDFHNQAAIAESQAFQFDLKEANEQKVGLRKANILCGGELDKQQKRIDGLQAALKDLQDTHARKVQECQDTVRVSNEFALEAREAKEQLAKLLADKSAGSSPSVKAIHEADIDAA